MCDSEFYKLIEEEYKKTLKEISQISGKSIEEVDKLITDTINSYYNVDDGLESLLNKVEVEN